MGWTLRGIGRLTGDIAASSSLSSSQGCAATIFQAQLKLQPVRIVLRGAEVSVIAMSLI